MYCIILIARTQGYTAKFKMASSKCAILDLAASYGKTSRHFEKKAKSNSHWSVTITSETANLDQSECRKINSHLDTNTVYAPEFKIFALN